MNATSTNKTMGINIKNYPMHLLIPSIDNVITIQAIHYLSKENQFKFTFEGENLEITTCQRKSHYSANQRTPLGEQGNL